MATEQIDKYSVVVLPFLKTDEPATVGRITFRSTRDTECLSSSQAESVSSISRMLYLKDDFRLTDASYAVVPRIDVDSSSNNLEYMRDVQSILSYIYAAPRHAFGDIFLSPEYASMAVFTPGKVPRSLVCPEHFVEKATDFVVPDGDHRDEIDGCSGLYNFRHHFWVTEGSRLYGPLPHLTLNLSQNLCRDISEASSTRCDFRLLIGLLDSKVSEASDRVFSALRWFNAANSRSADYASAIVSLAIAFEALMKLPASEKSERLTDTISLLLGRVPRLDVWATQFYSARSQVVHEGTVQSTRFMVSEAKHGKDGRQYQSLLSYGRTVFQLCLGTLLTGIELSEKSNLCDIFVTNVERFQEINKVLSDEQKPFSERLLSIRPIVATIEKYRYVPEERLESKTIIGAAKSAAHCFVQTQSECPEPLAASLKQLAASNRSADGFTEMKAIMEVQRSSEKVCEKASLLTPQLEAILQLVHTSWSYLFNDYYRLKDCQKS